MRSEKTLQRVIHLEPSELSKDITTNVRDAIRSLYVGTLSGDGYVIDIPRIYKWEQGTVMDDATVLFEAEFKADVYEIQIGNKYDCRVISSSTFGIYAVDPKAPENTATFFVPSNKIKGDDYNNGDWISLQVCALRLTNEYVCICSIFTEE